MEFKEFWSLCKYHYLGYDGNGGFESVCRKPDRIPPGRSWGKCRVDYCPYFGIEVKDAKIFSGGKEIGTIKELTFVMNTEEKR